MRQWIGSALVTSSNGNIFHVTGLFEGNSPVTGEYPSQKPVTLIFDVFFDRRLDKRLSKWSRRRWLETPSRPLWRPCDVPWPVLDKMKWNRGLNNHIYTVFCVWCNYSCMHHDDVIKWKHFPRSWPFARGIHRSPVNSTHKGQWRGTLMFSLICAWING